jgi:hypothetical protein
LPHFIKTSWWWRATPGSNMLVLIFPNPFLFILIFKSWYLGNMIKALHAMGGRTYLPPPPLFFLFATFSLSIFCLEFSTMRISKIWTSSN